jgi:LuxR family maltose regulon positive regulatory protein
MVMLATRMPSPARPAPSMVAAGRNAALPSETVPQAGPGWSAQPPPVNRMVPPPAARIVDPLTSRELEVLRMLAAGRSNQAIAGELVVTLDTVKKHVGHVLAKLGAANRTEAVARARELSLIL